MDTVDRMLQYRLAETSAMGIAMSPTASFLTPLIVARNGLSTT